MKTVVEKIMEFRKLAKSSLQNLSDEEMMLLVDHVARFQEGNRKYLNDREKMIMDVCMKYGYKPRTLKNNLVFFRLPKHIQDQIINGDLFFSHAIELYRSYKQKTDKEIETEIRKTILKAIETLPDYFEGEDTHA